MDIDYSKLTRRELEDVAAHIKRQAYPDQAAKVDAECERRRGAGHQEPTLQHQSSGRAWLLAAAVVFLIGLVPFVVAVALDRSGVIEMGNGLGLGLVLWLSQVIAAVLLLIGDARARHSRRQR